MSGLPSERPRNDGDAAPEMSVRRAARFLAIVDVITEANRPLLPTMTEKYFRRMVLRMAEHQLLYEEYQDKRA